MLLKYSVIIPTLNSGEYIRGAIESTRKAFNDCEIVVSDGGSHDNTRNIAASMGAILVSSPQGRGIQLMEGFKCSTRDIIIFLHSDTLIAHNAGDVLERYFMNREVQVAKFSMRFDSLSWVLSIYSGMAKIDSFWTSFGDQGIVVRRGFFEVIGGFPCWPLLEDVDFFRKARAKSKVHTLPVEVITSAERFMTNGLIRQQFLNFSILLKYLLGFSVPALSLEYENKRKKE